MNLKELIGNEAQEIQKRAVEIARLQDEIDVYREAIHTKLLPEFLGNREPVKMGSKHLGKEFFVEKLLVLIENDPKSPIDLRLQGYIYKKDGDLSCFYGHRYIDTTDLGWKSYKVQD